MSYIVQRSGGCCMGFLQWRLLTHLCQATTPCVMTQRTSKPKGDAIMWLPLMVRMFKVINGWMKSVCNISLQQSWNRLKGCNNNMASLGTGTHLLTGNCCKWRLTPLGLSFQLFWVVFPWWLIVRSLCCNWHGWHHGWRPAWWNNNTQTLPEKGKLMINGNTFICKHHNCINVKKFCVWI